jgi:hypothetical protein
MAPTQSPEDSRLAGRNGAIWRAHISGATQEAIAAEHGIHQTRVSQIIREIRETLPPEERSHLVTRETEFLDHLRRIALDLVDRPPIPAYSNGKPILMPPDPDGTQAVAEDHSGRLAAWDRALRAHERLSKLLGLDAAAKVDATVHTDPGDIELVQRIEAWKAAQDGPEVEGQDAEPE